MTGHRTPAPNSASMRFGQASSNEMPSIFVRISIRRGGCPS
ncbi:hypothetical protein AKJ09_11055 [Labilithrix luteola]|uniref:Uncharacterized protein n=1 Tax=Labilithrix luteola TaxID=1391654 RepID=A0A0K1QFG6_9BACT|nr:hypothetical protein AKJ09_11055 [Labilithrix luteola]